MKKYILLAAAAISLAACSSEDNYIDEPVAAQISASIGLSRASDDKWAEGDNIGITMGSRYQNMSYTTVNGDGVFTGTTMYFGNKVDPLTITAYYPYSGTEGQLPEVIEASTTAARQTSDEQPLLDFLYDMKENVTGAQPNIYFNFRHMMSKLTLMFINGNLGTDVRKITSCEITGFALDGTFNPATGECAAKADSPAALSMAPSKTDDKVSLSLILFPQTVGTVTVKITDSDNQEYSCGLKFDGNRLVSGNNYLFTIKVNKTSMNVQEYAIANWTLQSAESNAESE